MLLAIDIGNTEITLGLFGDTELLAHWRLTTTQDRTADEWATHVIACLAHAGYRPDVITASIYGSVAPAVSKPLGEGVGLATGVTAVPVGPESDLPIVLDVEEPMTVGADRVVNTLAASELYACDTVVVDYGTATTFDCITGDGRFLGGVIAPGVQTAADQLISRTAKVPATELTVPRAVIGRRTEDCVRSGVLFGAAEATDGIVRRIRAEWPGESAPLVVATGGLAPLVAPLAREVSQVEPNLTLLGLRMAARHLGIVGS